MISREYNVELEEQIRQINLECDHRTMTCEYWEKVHVICRDKSAIGCQSLLEHPWRNMKGEIRKKCVCPCHEEEWCNEVR